MFVHCEGEEDGGCHIFFPTSRSDATTKCQTSQNRGHMRCRVGTLKLRKIQRTSSGHRRGRAIFIWYILTPRRSNREQLQWVWLIDWTMMTLVSFIHLDGLTTTRACQSKIPPIPLVTKTGVPVDNLLGQNQGHVGMSKPASKVAERNGSEVF